MKYRKILALSFLSIAFSSPPLHIIYEFHESQENRKNFVIRFPAENRENDFPLMYPQYVFAGANDTSFVAYYNDNYLM